jgi:putative ABC transport system permease protein
MRVPPRLDLGPLLRTLRRQPMVFALVVLEIAAGVATISSLLMAGRWYGRTAERPSGLDEENLVLVSTYTPGAVGPGRDEAAVAAVERSVRAQQEADRRLLRSLPDVEAVAPVTITVLDDRWCYPTLFTGFTGSFGSDPQVGPRSIPSGRGMGWTVYSDEELLAAMRLPILNGTAPGPGRRSGALITRTFAEQIFGGVGRAPGSTIASEQSRPMTILGVVEDVRMRMPFMPNGRTVAFVFTPAPFDHEARLLVRARPGRREAVLARAEAAFAPDAATRFVQVRAFDSMNSLHHRIGSGLLRMLGVFGVMLGVVVLMGALASTWFLVAQRTRQIGVRRALGATRADIVAYFLLESTVTIALGSALGVIGAFTLYLMMRKVFSEISFDLGLIGATLALLSLASILATLIPALRAARVPPGVASRSL